MIADNRGSPPLVRERQDAGCRCRQCIGITPARAGKTRIKINIPVVIQDHPRSCGKDDEISTHLPVSQGSPPLVRERLDHITSYSCKGRITPARAGKTKNRTFWTGTRGDHPRSCGKDLPIHLCLLLHLGSPPLVRERHDLTNVIVWTVRITPARAGKTFIKFIDDWENGDHPRSCGKDT